MRYSGQGPTEGEPSADHLGVLADAVGVSRREFLAHLGGAWTTLDLGVWAHDQFDPADAPAGLWFRSGEPIQVLLGLVGLSLSRARLAVVAFPDPVMNDWRMDYVPRREHARIDLSQPGCLATLQHAVTAVATRRRKGFFWCTICRTCNAPEDRFEAGVCHGCAQQYLGVVA